MLQIYPILLAAAVLLADSIPPEEPLSFGWATALAVGPVALIVIVVAVVLWRAERQLRQGRGTRDFAIAGRVTSLARGALLVVHGAAVLWFGWLHSVRDAIGDLVLIDELIVLAPPLVGLLAIWWLQASLDLWLHGTRRASVWARWAYAIGQARQQLLLVLVPILGIMAVGETAEVLFEARWAVELASLGGALLVFLFAPFVARFALSCTPLPAGELRDTLAGICKMHGVRVRQFYLWRTGGTIVNAAVVGLVGPLRAVLLTDAMVAGMPRDEVIAVFAHEVGHIKRHHMPWMLVTLIALLALAAMMVGGPLLFAETWLQALPDDEQHWVDIGITVLTGVLALLMFGWVSRRFERQADTFAVQHLSGLGVVDDDARVTAEATQMMRGALGEVAWRNAIDVRRRSWRHGSIAWRQRYIDSLVGQSLDGLAIDRQIRWLKRLSLLVVAAAVVWTVVEPMVFGPTGSVHAVAESARMPACSSPRCTASGTGTSSSTASSRPSRTHRPSPVKCRASIPGSAATA